MKLISNFPLPDKTDTFSNYVVISIYIYLHRKIYIYTIENIFQKLVILVRNFTKMYRINFDYDTNDAKKGRNPKKYIYFYRLHKYTFFLNITFFRVIRVIKYFTKNYRINFTFGDSGLAI